MSDRKFVENAANAFMILAVTIARWEGVAKLKKGAQQAAIDAGADPDVFRGYVNLLGRHHADLKKVKALYMAIYNYLYTVSLPFERGQYLVPVNRVPEVLATLQKMQQEADSARDTFLAEYDRMVRIAQSQSMGRWALELRQQYPSAASIRERFGVDVRPPQAVPALDMARYGSLPVKVAEAIVKQSDARLVAQLEAAKEQALAEAHEHMEKVAKQLHDGERLHATLLSNAQRVAQKLRDFTEGYDRDPRLLALADDIMTGVCNVTDKDIWNTAPHLRSDAAKVAAKVSRNLSSYRKAEAKIAAAADDKSDVALGGLLAELTD